MGPQHPSPSSGISATCLALPTISRAELRCSCLRPTCPWCTKSFCSHLLKGITLATHPSPPSFFFFFSLPVAYKNNVISPVFKIPLVTPLPPLATTQVFRSPLHTNFYTHCLGPAVHSLFTLVQAGFCPHSLPKQLSPNDFCVAKSNNGLSVCGSLDLQWHFTLSVTPFLWKHFYFSVTVRPPPLLPDH